MEHFEPNKESVDKGMEKLTTVSGSDESSWNTASKLKRDHDSIDDFEHLEHESSPVQEVKDMAASPRGKDILAQLVDVPRAVETLGSIDTNATSIQQSLLDTSLPQHEKDLQPAPPSAADFQKGSFEDVLDKPINDVRDILDEFGTAQPPQPFHDSRTQSAQVSRAKALTMAFMESERATEPYLPQSSDTLHAHRFTDVGRDDLVHLGTEADEYSREKLSEKRGTSNKADPFSVLGGEDSVQGIRETLEARVSEAKDSISKSASDEQIFEDLAKAALQMPAVQDVMDPKEDIFEERNKPSPLGPELSERDLFGQERPTRFTGTREKVDLGFEDRARDLKEAYDVPFGENESPELPKRDSFGQERPDQFAGTREKVDLDFEERARDPKEAFSEIKSSVLPEPEKSPEIDFLKDDVTPGFETGEVLVKGGQKVDDDSWNVVEKPEKHEGNAEVRDKFDDRDKFEAPTKSLPPIPRDASPEPISSGTPEPFEAFGGKEGHHGDRYEMSSEFIANEGSQKFHQAGAETGDSEFESEPESCPIVPPSRATQPESTTKSKNFQTQDKHGAPAGHRKDPVEEIAPQEIFREMGLDAWFNPERLNPKVEALIYWRDPKKSGIVFGVTLGVLLSLAYFSFISVLAYVSLITLTGTVGFRVYKTVLQAVQKTSDGHPFKDVLDLDLTVPAERVHDIADVAVAHANAAIFHLRKIFLVEDLVDSLKFGVFLWCLTYVGSWFNGMTLIIIGVVALFTFPKVYETNKTQIDENVDIVKRRITEITNKIKAAIPIGKKPEPTKDE